MKLKSLHVHVTRSLPYQEPIVPPIVPTNWWVAMAANGLFWYPNMLNNKPIK